MQVWAKKIKRGIGLGMSKLQTRFEVVTREDGTKLNIICKVAGGNWWINWRSICLLDVSRTKHFCPVDHAYRKCVHLQLLTGCWSSEGFTIEWLQSWGYHGGRSTAMAGQVGMWWVTASQNSRWRSVEQGLPVVIPISKTSTVFDSIGLRLWAATGKQLQPG